MNENQVVSLITLVTGCLVGYAVQKGYVDKDTGSQIGAGLIALFVALLAHLWHRDPPADAATAPAPASGTAAKVGTLCALLGLSALLMSVCATAPTTAFKVESGVQVSVVTAASAWNSYVAANHPSAAVELQVRAAFEKYQRAELLAIDVTASYASVTATNAPLAASNLAAASTAVTNDLNELVSLLQSFGVKI